MDDFVDGASFDELQDKSFNAFQARVPFELSPFPAQINSVFIDADGTPWYGWQECMRNPGYAGTGLTAAMLGSLCPFVGGRSGGFNGAQLFQPAREVNDNLVRVPCFVDMRQVGALSGTILFQFSAPDGTLVTDREFEITDVSQVCAIKNALGYVTDIVVEHTTYLFPQGEIVDVWCETSPTDCCPTYSISGSGGSGGGGQPTPPTCSCPQCGSTPPPIFTFPGFPGLRNGTCFDCNNTTLSSLVTLSCSGTEQCTWVSPPIEICNGTTRLILHYDPLTGQWVLGLGDGTVLYTAPASQFNCQTGGNLNYAGDPGACTNWPVRVPIGVGPETQACNLCPNGAPLNWSVTFAGVSTGSSGLCTSCSNMNGTFLVPWLAGCGWHLTGVGFCTGGINSSIGINVNSSTVTVTVDWSTNVIAIYTIPYSQFNCLGENTLSLQQGGPSCNVPSTMVMRPG